MVNTHLIGNKIRNFDLHLSQIRQITSNIIKKYIEEAKKAAEEENPYLCFFYMWPVPGKQQGILKHRKEWCIYKGCTGFSTERCKKCWGFHDMSCITPVEMRHLPDAKMPEAVAKAVPYVVKEFRRQKEEQQQKWLEQQKAGEAKSI